LVEMFEDIKGAIRDRNSQMNKQFNDQNKNDKRTNNNLQNTTSKTKD
jgi:hypothetical protein